jgi:hypothetical protein
VAPARDLPHFAGAPTLQRTHELITRSNGWGQFMAYQAVVDMRFTALLDQRRRRRDLGGGRARHDARAQPAARSRKVDCALSQAQALTEMRAIYKVVQQETGVAMDFSDVPNILCETDKYLRVKNGEGKPRALYVPGRGHRLPLSDEKQLQADMAPVFSGEGLAVVREVRLERRRHRRFHGPRRQLLLSGRPRHRGQDQSGDLSPAGAYCAHPIKASCSRPTRDRSPAASASRRHVARGALGAERPTCR